MITVEPFKKNFGVVRGASMIRLFQLNGSFPSKHYMTGGSMVIQLTGANIEAMQEAFPDGIDWQCDEAKEFLNVQIMRDTSADLKEELETNLEIQEPLDYEFKTTPYKHQEIAFRLAKDLPFFAYFMEMGCGKTKVAIDDAAYQYEMERCDLVLILAPNGVHVQWIEEQIPTHIPDRIPHKAAYYRSYLKSKEKKALQAACEYTEGLRLISVNIEALSHASGLTWCQELIKTGKRVMIILDESSRIKTPGSKRTRNIIKLGKLCSIRRILTGSPVTSGVENLFSQLKFLSESILGLSSFLSFKARYCIMQTFDNYQKIIGYRMLDELKNKMDPWVYRVRKEDCLDLPPKTYVEYPVEMAPEQKKLYAQMLEDLMVELENGLIVDAPIAIVKLLRLQQILSGHLPDEEGGLAWELAPDKNPRVQALLQLLDDCPGQIIVWARFKFDLYALEKVLKPFGVVSYHGGASQADRVKAIKDFKSGEARIFLGNPAAAGIGLNLVGPLYSIYYSNSYDAEQRWQSEDRNHRIGTTGNVTYYDFVAGPMDRKIIRALRDRKNLANLTIDGIKELLKDE